MNKNIVLFNVIFYAVTLFFFQLGRNDPSSSLGYGFFIFFFWILSAIVLVFFLVRRTIWPESLLDAIGIFTATPVLCILIIRLILSLNGGE
jgi:uncharacterized membrane protein YedE/YeeE